MNANGAFAAHFAMTSLCPSPSKGRSTKNGGLFGFGDHAAATANVAVTMKCCPARSSRLLIFARPSSASFGGAPRAPRQHGLMTYKLPNTSACFMPMRSEEHTSELQSRENLVCRLLLEKKKKNTVIHSGST